MPPAEDWIRVTASSYPLVYAAFESLREKHQPAYNVPPEYSRDLPHTEQFLAGLNEEDRFKLCNGDYDPRIPSFAYEAAITVLAAFLYEWRAVVFAKKRRAFRS